MSQHDQTLPDSDGAGKHQYPALNDVYPALRHNVQDVNLHVLLQRLWMRRRLFILWVIVFMLFGVLLVLGSRREYRASTTLVPEQHSEQAGGGLSAGLLAQFGGLLGGGLGGLTQSESALTFDLFPDVLESTPVQLALLQTPVGGAGIGSTMTLRTYLDEHLPFGILDVPGAALGGVLGALRGGGGSPPAMGDSTILATSPRDEQLIAILRDRLAVRFDQKSGVLDISAEMPDPQVAAQTARAAVVQLTTYVTAYRLTKLADDLQFLEGRLEEARGNFDAASRALAAFRDRNRNLASDLARTEEQRLEAEFDVAYTLYSSLVSQVEEARIRVQKETPVFQVLEPVKVPHRKSSPQTVLILALFLLLGIVTSAAYIAAEPNVKSMKRMLHQADVQKKGAGASV